MKISLIHPSRSRPKQAYSAYYEWINNSDRKFEYILSIDKSDPLLDEYLNIFPRKSILVSDNKSAIEAINNAAKLSTGDLIIVMSDDFSCEPNWDTNITEELLGKSDFLVKTIDGIQDTLITLPILDRKYYKRFGYIYFPGYIHLWCDTEMTTVGHFLGKVINSNLRFHHNHYTAGLSEKDEVNIKNDATNEQGDKLFNERLKTNFGIERPLTTFDKIEWRKKIKISILIATMPSRAGHLFRLGGILAPQLNDNVEVVVDCSMDYNIGSKRQIMLSIAKGDYVVYIDDDDIISDDYISKVLKACESGADCIGISGKVTTDGQNEKRWHISKDYGSWYEKDNIYYRTPNHISPVRRELALKTGFKPMDNGEDYDYSIRLLPLLKTECKVKGDLYFYAYSSRK